MFRGAYDQLIADGYSIIDFKPVGIKTCGHLVTNASHRKYLTDESAKTLMRAYVISRVDYCNGLSYGLSNSLLRKLQSVSTRVARVVKLTSKYDNSVLFFKAPSLYSCLILSFILSY